MELGCSTGAQDKPEAMSPPCLGGPSHPCPRTCPQLLGREIRLRFVKLRLGSRVSFFDSAKRFLGVFKAIESTQAEVAFASGPEPTAGSADNV